MSNIVFLKRILTNKIYWLSAVVAVMLLCCSEVYVSPDTGESFTFISLFYDETVEQAMILGEISLRDILFNYDVSYLWMFAPIIVSVPYVLIGKTERFLMFRTGKNKYCMSGYAVGIVTSGFIMVIAYVIYGGICSFITDEIIWDDAFMHKLQSVFCWGVYMSMPAAVLSEFVYNRYLILCIPFVVNYFMCMFVGNILPYDISNYIQPYIYQVLHIHDDETVNVCISILAGVILACGIMKKIVMERRCDCGQR